MNTDLTQTNQALYCTNHHVDMISKICQTDYLKGMSKFSEMGMGHGYHQIPLAKDYPSPYLPNK